jgi:hypothetical protein
VPCCAVCALVAAAQMCCLLIRKDPAPEPNFASYLVANVTFLTGFFTLAVLLGEHSQQQDRPSRNMHRSLQRPQSQHPCSGTAQCASRTQIDFTTGPVPPLPAVTVLFLGPDLPVCAQVW